MCLNTHVSVTICCVLVMVPGNLWLEWLYVYSPWYLIWQVLKTATKCQACSSVWWNFSTVDITHCSWIPTYASGTWGSLGAWTAEKKTCMLHFEVRREWLPFCWQPFQGISVKEIFAFHLRFHMFFHMVCFSRCEQHWFYKMAWCLTWKCLCCRQIKSQV